MTEIFFSMIALIVASFAAFRPQFDVDFAPRQVVQNGHVVADRRKMQRGRPAAKAVAATNQDRAFCR
jgi:hypothetical protein